MALNDREAAAAALVVALAVDRPFYLHPVGMGCWVVLGIAAECHLAGQHRVAVGFAVAIEDHPDLSSVLAEGDLEVAVVADVVVVVEAVAVVVVAVAATFAEFASRLACCELENDML